MAQKYQATLIRGTSHTLMGVGKFTNGNPVIVDEEIKKKLERCVETVTLTGGGKTGSQKQQICRFKFVKVDADGNPLKGAKPEKAKPAPKSKQDDEGLAGDGSSDEDSDDEDSDTDDDEDEDEEESDTSGDGDAFDDDEEDEDEEVKPAPKPAAKKAAPAKKAAKKSTRDR